MKKIIITILGLGMIFNLSAQSLLADSTVTKIAKNIQAQDIRTHLEILAADDMEGRETGEKGQKKAAQYIESQYERIGLETSPNGTYVQEIKFLFNNWNDISISIRNKKYRYMRDFYAFSLSNNSYEDSIKADEVVFLGYGIDSDNYSDYEGVNVKDKIILIYQGEPLNKDSVSYVTGRRAYSQWALNWKKKLETAKKKGVKAVLFIEPEINTRVSRYRDRLLSGQTTMGVDEGISQNFANSAYISKRMAKDLIGKKYLKKVIKARQKIAKKGKSYHVNIPTEISMVMQKQERFLQGENLLGFIEGSDEKLKKDLIIVSAHYDHLGKRGADIYNGADDNGSGTSAVLEIAETIAQAKKMGFAPRRSILFLLVSGEEKGLLGSKYYVNFPVYPLENTITNVNVDMIGRVDDKHLDNPDYIYVIGSDRLSSELHQINENVNEKYTQIELDYTYNAEDDPNRYYYRSDHYSFAEKGIPAIFYFSGVHSDYHRTTDTVEKINFEKTTRIAKLIFHTIWQLANQDKTIEVDVK